MAWCPWTAQGPAQPRPFSIHLGHNCSLSKAPLLPNQEILKEGCPSLPESTLAAKRAGEGARRKTGPGTLLQECGPHMHTHTRRHSYAPSYAHTHTH